MTCTIDQSERDPHLGPWPVLDSLLQRPRRPWAQLRNVRTSTCRSLASFGWLRPVIARSSFTFATSTENSREGARSPRTISLVAVLTFIGPRSSKRSITAGRCAAIRRARPRRAAASPHQRSADYSPALHLVVPADAAAAHLAPVHIRRCLPHTLAG